MYTLSLKPEKRSGSRDQTEVNHHDFLIDGKSLSEIIGIGDLDMVGIFADWSNEKYNKIAAKEILLEEKASLDSERFCIYVCPECGDVGCGAITIKISETDTSFIWSDFGYENDYEEIREYKNIGPYEFEKEKYKELINPFLNVGI